MWACQLVKIIRLFSPLFRWRGPCTFLGRAHICVGETTMSINLPDKIAVFRRCFAGLSHVYGTYDPQNGRSRQVKAPVTDQVIADHILGRRPYGVYLLVGDRTQAVVADFDHDDLNPPMAFLAAARRYELTAHLERSKAKGFHAWVFFDPAGTLAWKARRVIRHILDEIGFPDTEVFPKQDRLQSGHVYGNFINCPLFGQLVTKGRTVFLDSRNPHQVVSDQWALLRQVRRVTEAQLDQVIELNGLADPACSVTTTASPSGSADRTYGLPPCARRILAEGVTANQRVTCFRLAVQLKRAGIPRDLAIPLLRTWAAKNKPESCKRVITEDEIQSQVAHAYLKAYRGCGCEEPAIQAYCDAACPIYPRVAHARDICEAGEAAND